jgi:phage terminase Nu1 subunit (DNA packaging protein)
MYEGYQTVSQLAKLLEITEVRIRQLSKEGYIPKEKRNTYPTIGTIQGYIRFLRTRKKNFTGPDMTDEESGYLDANLELAKLSKQQTIAKVYENKTTAGELLPASEHEFEMSRVIKAIANWIEILPDRLEREVGLDAKQIIKLQKITDNERESLYEQLVKHEE